MYSRTFDFICICILCCPLVMGLPKIDINIRCKQDLKKSVIEHRMMVDFSPPQCLELQGYVRPLLELLNGLKKGRFDKGETKANCVCLALNITLCEDMQ